MLDLNDVRFHTEIGTGYCKDFMLNLCADEIDLLKTELAEALSYKDDAERYRYWLGKYCFIDATNHRLNLDKEMKENKPTKGVTNE